MACTANSSAICAKRSRRSRSGTATNSLSLRGVRVVLTRARSASDETAGRLRDLGADVVEVALIRIVPPPDQSALAAAAARTDIDWIAFASAHGVESFARGCDRPRDVRAKLAAVGPATARAIREAFGRAPDLVPDEFTAAALGTALAAAMKTGERALLVQAYEARPEAREALERAGRIVETVAAYATRQEPSTDIAGAIQNAHVVILASGSAARSLSLALGQRVQALLAGKLIVCIGPVTAQEARSVGIPETLVPREFTMAGVIEVVVERMAERPDGHAIQ